MEFSRVENKEITNSKFYYFVDQIERCNERVALLDWFTARERPTLYSIPDDVAGSNIIAVKGAASELKALYSCPVVHVPKKHIDGVDLTKTDIYEECYVYGVSRVPDNVTAGLLFKLSDDVSQPPFFMHEKFIIHKGMIANYNEDKPLTTDVGKFLLNQLILVYPFGSRVPYLNDTFNPSKLDDIVARMILDGQIGRDEYNKYMNYGFWFCEDGTINLATWSIKSLTTDPNIRKRRDELLAKYKDQLKDPIVASKIEDELIAMDKKWLEGDSSASFYQVEGKKTWNDHRKTMYLMMGLGQAFDKDGGKFTFVPESLEESWQLEHLDIAADLVRRGSYGRGKSTAQGGSDTKFILRIFQDITIMEDDCKTNNGAKFKLTEGNKRLFLGRYLTDGTLLDTKTIDKYVGKIITLRSPLYCKSKKGFCYKCCGEIVKKLGLKRIGMQALVISSGWTSLAMKAQHQNAAKSTTIDDFFRFLR